jgi:deoxyribodipyrimidine photo-lyase
MPWAGSSSCGTGRWWISSGSLEPALQSVFGDQVTLHRYSGRLLFEPEMLVKQDGTPYRVFTPFWKAALAQPGPREPRPAPGEWPAAARLPSDSLEDWRLLPSTPDWAAEFRQAWCPGEHGAAQALEQFLEERVAAYKDDRDRPDRPGTSRLSAHLRWGEISPRRVWHVAQAQAVQTRQAKGTDAFLRELGWREFSSHLLYQFPKLPTEPLRPEFAAFPWQDDEQALVRWQQGLTGYPIVDAGMRELWTTGWMHNRVRMIVASFLVKDLLLPWQRGEAWFWDTLVDADLANNSASWQWVAGCGADAAPFFRVFNPTLQGQKFDPEGAYVRRWIPELEGIPDKSVHTPWLARHAGTEYPEPMVDHAAARKRALEAFQKLKDKSTAA